MDELRFKSEAFAYAQLLHCGLADCGTGIVPHCYGWFDLGTREIEKILALPYDPSVIREPRMMRPGTFEAKAIVFEYFPGAQYLSSRYFTDAVAEEALRTLHEIHSAYIYHRRIRPQSILIVPVGDGGSVVRLLWHDFANSVSLWRPVHADPPGRRDLLGELAYLWESFYHYWVRQI